MAALRTDLGKGFPDNQVINIVAFGHSVPAGYGDTPVVHKVDAYPRIIEDGLAAAYPTAVFNVITSAVGGSNSTAGLLRLQRGVLDLHPRAVMVDFGVNDLVIPLETAKSNLTNIIGEVRAAGACPVLVTPTWYVGADEPEKSKGLADQVAMIRRLGSDLDVPVADAFKAFSAYAGDKKDLMETSNHPNRKGHEVIAGEVLPLFIATGQPGRAVRDIRR